MTDDFMRGLITGLGLSGSIALLLFTGWYILWEGPRILGRGWTDAKIKDEFANVKTMLKSHEEFIYQMTKWMKVEKERDNESGE